MIPHPTFWWCILILSPHLCLDLPSGLLPSGFPTITLHGRLLSLVCATHPTHLIPLDLITWIMFSEEHRSLNSSSPCPCCLVPLRPK
jgi:hypothetical protein